MLRRLTQVCCIVWLETGGEWTEKSKGSREKTQYIYPFAKTSPETHQAWLNHCKISFPIERKPYLLFISTRRHHKSPANHAEFQAGCGLVKYSSAKCFKCCGERAKEVCGKKNRLKNEILSNFREQISQQTMSQLGWFRRLAIASLNCFRLANEDRKNAPSSVSKVASLPLELGDKVRKEHEGSGRRFFNVGRGM